MVRSLLPDPADERIGSELALALCGHSFAFDREPVTTTDGARLSGVRENRTPTPCAACHFIAADGTAIGRP